MVAFIDDHRDDYGVEPTAAVGGGCAVLPIAPSTYYACKAREADPALCSARAQSDGALRAEIQRVWDESRSRYGATKVWKQLRREGFAVARCTVARLMCAMGLKGVVRGRRVRTTVPANLADRPLDLVERDFTAARPNPLWVSDLTYVAPRRAVFVDPIHREAGCCGHRAVRRQQGGFVRLRSSWCPSSGALRWGGLTPVTIDHRVLALTCRPSRLGDRLAPARRRRDLIGA